MQRLKDSRGVEIGLAKPCCATIFRLQDLENLLPDSHDSAAAFVHCCQLGENLIIGQRQILGKGRGRNKCQAQSRNSDRSQRTREKHSVLLPSRGAWGMPTIKLDKLNSSSNLQLVTRAGRHTISRNSRFFAA